jgi:hypothetical protein
MKERSDVSCGGSSERLVGVLRSGRVPALRSRIGKTDWRNLFRD